MIYNIENIMEYIETNDDIKKELSTEEINKIKEFSNKDAMNYVIEHFFVSKNHKLNMEQKYCFSQNYCFSFRRAGYYTINNIEMGAAPKPHRILDKSIKKNEVKDKESALIGLVPYRDENEKILGLYITNNGLKHFSGKCTIYQDEYEKKNLFIKPDKGDDIEIWFKELTKYNMDMSWFVTGDYDMHDMIINNSIVVSDGYDEARVLLELGSTMMGKTAGEIKNFKFYPYEYSPIQHGPQYNYIAHMKDKEPNGEIVREVAHLSKDVAFFYKNQWVIIYSSEIKEQCIDFDLFYSTHISKKLKWSWKGDERANTYIGQFTPAKEVKKVKKYKEYKNNKK